MRLWVVVWRSILATSLFFLIPQSLQACSYFTVIANAVSAKGLSCEVGQHVWFSANTGFIGGTHPCEWWWEAYFSSSGMSGVRSIEQHHCTSKLPLGCGLHMRQRWDGPSQEEESHCFRRRGRYITPLPGLGEREGSVGFGGSLNFPNFSGTATQQPTQISVK